MIREVNRREALHLLAGGGRVYFLDMENFRLADLSAALDGKLLAEVTEDPAEDPESRGTLNVPVKISETMTVELEQAPVKDVSHAEKPAEKETEKSSKRVKQKMELDMGKIKACRKAGRSIEWIADELGVSQQTIRNRLKEMGMK